MSKTTKDDVQPVTDGAPVMKGSAASSKSAMRPSDIPTLLVQNPPDDGGEDDESMASIMISSAAHTQLVRPANTLTKYDSAAAFGLRVRGKLDDSDISSVFSLRMISNSTFTWVVQVGLCTMFWKEMMNSYFDYGTYLSGSLFSLVPTATLVDMGASSVNVMRYTGSWARLFTGPFLHIGVTHVSCNVIVQAMYGAKLEKDWSFWRVLLVFFGSAYMGNAWSGVMNPCGATVGSSGGGFGLIGAYSVWILEHWNEHDHPRMLIISETIQTIVTICIGLSGQLDNWAHTTGLLTGACISLLTMERNDFMDTLDESVARESSTLVHAFSLIVIFSLRVFTLYAETRAGSLDQLLLNYAV
eukprot:GHVH01000449.1.p1 GENE.GHVH01000449.1~~GHVH01000449.1.p1  ORF type:complete len:357 (+),score=41.46 GHVH01000449.1:631-1701(+)